MELFDKLIELGADLDVHNLFGHSPLHTCFRHRADYIYNMAVKLLKAGANPNIQDRMKIPPLFGPAGNNRNLKAVDLLIKFGADPHVKNFVGQSVFDYVKSSDVEMLVHLRANEKERVKKARDDAKDKTDFKKCGNCKANASSRCKGCFLMWYCSAECQQAHWNSHRQFCKETWKQYEEAEIHVRATKTKSFHQWAGKDYKASLCPKESSFIVKISVERECFKLKAVNKETLLVCNKEKDAQFHMKANTPLGQKLVKIIEDNKQTDKGTYKGYFYCVYKKKEDKFYVNPSLLPEEKW